MRYERLDEQKSGDRMSSARARAQRRAGIMIGGVLVFFAAIYGAYWVAIHTLSGDAVFALALLMGFVVIPGAIITFLVVVLIAIVTVAHSPKEVSTIASQADLETSSVLESRPANSTRVPAMVMTAGVLILVLVLSLLSTGIISGGGSSPLNTPQGLAADRFGNVYVLVNQGTGGCIARFKPDGTSEDQCVQVDAQTPFAAAPDGSTYSVNGGFIVHRSIEGLRWGRWDAGDVRALAVSKDGSVYTVGAVGGAFIQVFSPDGALRRSWDIPPIGDMGVNLAADQHGNVYVVTTGGNDVAAYSATGRQRWQWHARLHLPEAATRNYLHSGIAVDRHGAIYVTGDTSNVVVKLSPNGRVLSRWRIPDTADQPNDMGVYGVESVTVDPNGNVYVTEPLRNEIVKFAANGTVLTTSFGT